MLVKIYSAAINGINAFPVTVETEIWKGVGFSIVGMADTAIRESYERMQAAIRHSGYEFPHYRITINLAPADIKK
ncbi:MAG: magnesium chelatase, partial [Muribaculaceae bacterium]|nr:magnesium chelatase [Muribaculaceae bacterium]